MHGVWCLITDFKSSTDLHISCIILIEKVYCSKFTLFKTRFISLSHFSFLHKIEYATPGCVFICQKKKPHKKKLVMSSLSTHGQSRICMYNVRLLSVRQLIGLFLVYFCEFLLFSIQSELNYEYECFIKPKRCC